jgi:hypothetical protein
MGEESFNSFSVVTAELFLGTVHHLTPGVTQIAFVTKS